MRFGAILGGAALLGLLCAAPLPLCAAEDPTPSQVGRAIANQRARVAEFEVIKRAAEELGIRVWLFGGTAAGFAHYVRWDLAREGGDERYRRSFFDYDFTNIYRSTQDADLVVDGTPEEAEQLEKLIKQKLSFLQGSKEHWEVRLLRQDQDTPSGQVKQALLNNPDFLGQHTDSNSTGMIELTDPPQGEGVVRDLRDWESGEPFFLQDVTAGRLHYYRSESHETTTRFREGHNPPIFSVIRYLVKAFQYGLQVDGEDLKQVRAIIDAFDPQRDPGWMSEWARGWLERYGPNLIRHAVDVEYAWNTLESLGLRQKLISLSKPGQQGTLGFWLTREPLRTRPVGTGQGSSAGELGISTVAHATSDFLAYESITRDTTLRPNVLVSREGFPGESAAYGSGFYTQRGRTGGKGSGFTIRFQVDPAAREGTDFTLHGDTVLFTNRAALRVIPESLDLSPVEYFARLKHGLTTDANERGVWMKLQRRLTGQRSRLSPEDVEQILPIVSWALEGFQDPGPGPLLVLRAWLELPVSTEHPEVDERLTLEYFRMLSAGPLDREGQPEVWARVKERLRSGHPLSPETEEEIASWVANSLNYSRSWTEGGLPQLVKAWLSLPLAERHPELFERLTARIRDTVSEVIDRVGGYRRYQGARQVPILGDWFLLPVSRSHPELLEALRQAVVRGIERPDLREEVRINDFYTLEHQWFRLPESRAHPEMLQAMIANGLEYAAANKLSRPAWSGHPELVQEMLDRGFADILIVQDALRRESWGDYPELMRPLIERAATIPDPNRQVSLLPHLVLMLREAHWRERHPELAQLFAERVPLESVVFLLRWSQFKSHPELVLTLLRRLDREPRAARPGSELYREIEGLLRESHWRGSAPLRELCGGQEPNLSCLQAAVRKEDARAAEIADGTRALSTPGGEECGAGR